MTDKRKRSLRLIAGVAMFSIAVSACGSDKKNGGTATSAGNATSTTAAVPEGGELIDGAQLASADNLTSYDPSLVQTLDESQVTTALFDGLTDFDFTDKLNPKLKDLGAEKIVPNSDATEFTITLKKGVTFSNGDPVLPSSYKYSWERGGSAKLASPYGYLINYVKGGAALQAGTSKVLDAVVADDTAMTLTVTLETPQADFPAIISHPFFSPLDKTVLEAYGAKHGGDTTNWAKDEAMIGNGPFKLDAKPNDQQVVLVRNDKWSGNVLGDTKAKLDKITFKISKDPESAYTDFEAGNLDTSTIPSGKYADAMAKYGNTVKSPTMGVYYYGFGWKDPVLGGAKNAKLRQAISMAIDREQINKKVYEGTRALPTGIVPPGVPGFKKGICKYCSFDLAGAKAKFAEWKAEGNSLTGPITLDFNTGGSHEDVVAIVQENLKAVGIASKTNPISEKYFGTMAKGGCHFCRSGWYADYPTYGNFTFDLFSTASLGGNNEESFSDPVFDKMLADAQKETDDVKRGELFNKAEDYLLNTVTIATPFNWYTGDQVYSDKVVGYDQPPLGIVVWERVGKKS